MYCLVLGLTFKENCPDLRNTRVVDVIDALRDYGVEVEVHDPCADPAEGRYDGIVLAVAHDAYREMGVTTLRRFGKETHLFCDLKSIFDKSESDLRL